MRTNPFYDAWLFLTGSTGEHQASGIGWLLTALFLALLVALKCLNILHQTFDRDEPQPRRSSSDTQESVRATVRAAAA